MYIKRQFSPVLIYFFTWRSLLKNFLLGTFVFILYQYFDCKIIAIPWLPVSLIGTAVAFFVGFKNNSSYDRQWEAGKVWGEITNLSRAFSSASKSFIINSNEAIDKTIAQKELKLLLYRHIAWLYALKHAMWQHTSWEHTKRVSLWYRNYFEKNLKEQNWEDDLSLYLSHHEIEWLKTKTNAPAQLLDLQTQHLQLLKNKGFIEDFRQMELQKMISDLFAEQGKTERIKNTPLPRQYASTAYIFIMIFTILLPFGMVAEFAALGEQYIWLLIPFNVIVGWVFDTMETAGDSSENPFEGLVNDIPLHYIIRNIEIDIRDMLNEKNLPQKIKPIHDTLM